ncbi:hypothetical protein H4V95_000453 [Arthrobacter sp. CAN_C5]|nr:hypothetical protein [Arthrobacter sp. CAN_C5]
MGSSGAAASGLLRLISVYPTEVWSSMREQVLRRIRRRFAVKTFRGSTVL